MMRTQSLVGSAIALFGVVLLAGGCMFLDRWVTNTATDSVKSVLASNPTVSLRSYNYATTSEFFQVYSVDCVIREMRSQGEMTNLVNKLKQAGDICAVLGHKWELDCLLVPVFGSTPSGPNRRCVVCGKVETWVGTWR